MPTLPAITLLKPRLLFVGQASLLLGVLLAPRIAAATAFLPALVLLALAGAPSWREVLTSTGTLIRVALAFGLYAFASLAWSVDPGEGIGKVAVYFGLLAGLVLVAHLLSRESDPAIAALGRATIVVVAAGLVLLAFEEVTDHAIRRMLFSVFPTLRPPAKHVVVVNGELESFGHYLTNRNMAALSMLLWPALGVVVSTRPRRFADVATAAGIVIGLVAVMHSEHDTSVLALLASGVIYLVARVSLRSAFALAAAGWVAATLLVVPIAKALYDQKLHLTSPIPHSGKQRIVLWGYTAEQIAKRPLFGVGIAATKMLDAGNLSATTPPGYPYPRRTGPHAHNIYLQTWYELGAVGALLLLALGGAILMRIRTAPERVQPVALAAFTSCATIGGFTWSLWQSWFMGLFAISIMVVVLAFEAAHRTGRTT